ncbi:MAG TPA: glycosyltransferase [Vicinamibacteria bacterium]
MGEPRGRGPILVAAAGFPPTITGSAVLNRNLWGAWPADDVVAVSVRLPGARVDPGLALPGVPVTLVEPWPFRRPRVAAQLDPFAAGAVARVVADVARRTQARAIWANWPNTPFLIGAWRAARELRLPLYVHLHDTWREAYAARPLPLERLAAWWYEGRLLRAARRLFTITDAAREHYLRSLGLDSTVLPHCVPAADLDRPPPAARPVGTRRVLHFAGHVYRAMNTDALAMLARALPLCRHDVILHCYTPSSAAPLAAAGIAGDRVEVRFGTRDEVMADQAAADLLVLPLAFRSPNPLEIRTVFPTKLLEYFVSGRPVLVHAPFDSWCARDAGAKGWAAVVDEPSPAALARAIDALLDDAPRQASLVAAARAEARRRAAPDVARALRAELEEIGVILSGPPTDAGTR